MIDKNNNGVDDVQELEESIIAQDEVALEDLVHKKVPAVLKSTEKFPEDEKPQPRSESFRDKLEFYVESFIFGSRWILAPIYIGLVVGLIVVVIRFFMNIWTFISTCITAPEDSIILGVLNLLDLALLGNLIIIVIFAGYENFVSKINVAEHSEDRPSWMGHLDYSGLKIKIIGSLVAISVIELLKDFLNAASPATTLDTRSELIRIGLHLTFLASGVLFAVMDYIADKRVIMEEETENKIINSTHQLIEEEKKKD